MSSFKLYTIPASVPFVDALAKWMLTRYAAEDPLPLAQALVLLPSRRACMSLREAFLRITEGKPLLLPRMQPIGDVDEEELLLSSWGDAPEIAQAVAEMTPVISRLRRRALLIRLVQQFARHRTTAVQGDYGMNLDQSALLADELARLLDDAAREEVPLAHLKDLVPQEYADHWQEILQFLNILTQRWPEILEQEGAEEPVVRRNRLIRLLSAHWQKHPPGFPVIAAGSTGSQPATADLLKCIWKMPQGAVVLPGVDFSLDAESWAAMEESHPQYGFKQLFERIGAVREDVEILRDDEVLVHGAALREALRPSETLHLWQKADIAAEALKGIRLAECQQVREEACVIALAMRQALETPGKRAALVTQDRQLARYVAAALRRFFIRVDDSAGQPLSLAPAAVFLRQILHAAGLGSTAHDLLGLLKHPLCAPGMNAAQTRESARLLEVELLRRTSAPSGIAAICSMAAAQAELKALARAVEHGFEPLEALSGRHRFSEWQKAHLEAAERLSAAHEDGIWAGEEGQPLQQFLENAVAATADFPPLELEEYLALQEQWMAQEVLRPARGRHPRLHILSPMEARLQQYDLMILGGMNEGSWPMDSRADPWMSRPMRGKFGLPLPERHIGQSAHDFLTLASAPEVLLTRSRKRGGSPTSPSRWLLRLEALLKGKGLALPVAEDLLGWAAQLDIPGEVRPMERPAPTPPVAARPRALSVTRVETLLRDPYAIYAEKILNLKKLDDIDQEIGPREFGNLVHEALEKFFSQNRLELDELRKAGEAVFQPLMHRPQVARYWWPRFERIAEWVLDTHRQRVDALVQLLLEVKGEYRFVSEKGEFLLTAAADRVEQRKDGSLCLVDYKTGQPPAAGEIQEGFSSQMVLEALIADSGEFKGVSGEVSRAEYWKISGGRIPGEVIEVSKPRKKKKGEKPEDGEEEAEITLQTLKQRADEGLKAVIAAYDRQETPYYAQPHPDRKPKYNDYEYLERVKEWG